MNTEWMKQAACQGLETDMFFPNTGGDISEIRRICQACPVNTDCLEYSLQHHIIHGIWGGLGERSRQRERQRRRKLQDASR